MSTAISIAMRSALSGLQVNQAALSVTSNNISNANTDGYTKKIADIQTRLVNGQGAGVEIENITRNVSDFLSRDLWGQASQLGTADTLNTYYTSMQEMFGQPGDSSSIAATVSSLGDKLQALSVDPSSTSAQQDVVTTAQTMTRQLNTMSSSIQNLRMQANQKIDTLVTQANSLIGKITELNTQVARNKALNKPTGDLEDERDRDVSQLASIMNISSFKRDDGQMVVLGPDGRTLVDTISATMAYSPASSMSADVSYPSNGIDGITINGADITNSITSGKLKALVDLRDTILPGLGDQLDQLASVMRDQLDTIHNQGTSIPPPNTLTGTRTFSSPSTDTVNMTGTVRIGVVDSSGKSVGTPIDLSLNDLATVVGGTPTVNNIVDAINGTYAASSPAIPGLSGATASVNASGELVIAANNASNGIAINESTSQEATTGYAFSHYFGLNNFFTGSSSGGLASNIAVRSDIAANPQLVARGELSNGTLASGDIAVASGDNTVASAMASKFQDTVSFAQAGSLAQTTSSFSDYAGSIVSANATSASAAKNDLSYRQTLYNEVKSRSDSQSGVNIDEELGNLILYQNAYTANARMITTLSDVMKTLTDLVR